MSGFDEHEHPRKPIGSPGGKGGEFTDKTAAGDDADLDSFNPTDRPARVFLDATGLDPLLTRMEREDILADLRDAYGDQARVTCVNTAGPTILIEYEPNDNHGKPYNSKIPTTRRRHGLAILDGKTGEWSFEKTPEPGRRPEPKPAATRLPFDITAIEKDATLSLDINRDWNLVGLRREGDELVVTVRSGRLKPRTIRLDGRLAPDVPDQVEYAYDPDNGTWVILPARRPDARRKPKPDTTRKPERDDQPTPTRSQAADQVTELTGGLGVVLDPKREAKRERREQRLRTIIALTQLFRAFADMMPNRRKRRGGRRR